MSKSSKKKRQEAKRRKELEKLRGSSSILDEESPVKRSLEPSPLPEAMNANPVLSQMGAETTHSSDGTNNSSSLVGNNRKRIDFVLPRSNGAAQKYLFDKEKRKQIQENLPAIPEVKTPAASASKPKAEESIDDILFPQKRRKLADKFEAVHRAEEDKSAGDESTLTSAPIRQEAYSETRVDIEAPKAPLKRKKKKRQRSNSLEHKNEERKDNEEISSTLNRTGDEDSQKDPKKQSEKVELKATPKSEIDTVNRRMSGRSVEQAVRDKSGLRPRANSTDGELNLPQRGLCDEQMVLQSHRWKDGDQFIHRTNPCGLNNLGNTCFLNSILQCLAYSPPFCQSLVKIAEAKTKDPKNGKQLKQNKGQNLTANLCNLFQTAHGFEHHSATSVSPHAIVKTLPTLGSIGSRNGYKFWPGRQEDAHEFLVHLLDAMHNGELRAAGINQHVSGWRDRLPVSRLDETTFVHRIFGGYFRSQVRCKACGYCSNTYDPFLDLSLEVSKDTSNSVMSAIREFTRRETLDAENQWKCSGCKKYVCPTKQLTVFRAPLCLCIQLKRFAFRGGMGGFGGSSFGTSWKQGKKKVFGSRSKIAKPIEFPADLNLPLSDGRSCAYTLTGVVIHVGGSASSGHYTSYIKKPGKNGKYQWFHADDSIVEPVAEKTVLKQKDAYMLFYCRKEVKLEFPSLPPRDMSTDEAMQFGRARARARADSKTEACVGDTEPTLKKSPETPPKKPEIHPLAKLLNDTMTEQVKAATSPVSKQVVSNEETVVARSNSFIEKVNDSSSTASASATPDQKKKNRAAVESDSSSTSGQSESSREAKHSSQQSGSNEGEHSPVTKEKINLVHPGAEMSLPMDTKENPTPQTSSDNSSSSSSSSSGGDDEGQDTLAKVATPQVASVRLGEGETCLSSDNSSDAGDESSMSTDDGRILVDVEDVEAEAEAKPAESSMPKSKKEHSKTRVVVSGADSRGKVKVMMGPRIGKAWVSKTSATNQRGSQFQLLGNREISKWDDEEQDLPTGAPTPKIRNVSHDKERQVIAEKMEKAESSRKRKMYLDRWDAHLDQGKTKKVKQKQEQSSFSISSSPKNNIFQRIQSGVQRMNKGRAKGLFRRTKTDGQGKRRNGFR